MVCRQLATLKPTSPSTLEVRLFQRCHAAALKGTVPLLSVQTYGVLIGLVLPTPWMSWDHFSACLYFCLWAHAWGLLISNSKCLAISASLSVVLFLYYSCTDLTGSLGSRWAFSSLVLPETFLSFMLGVYVAFRVAISGPWWIHIRSWIVHWPLTYAKDICTHTRISACPDASTCIVWHLLWQWGDYFRAVTLHSPFCKNFKGAGKMGPYSKYVPHIQGNIYCNHQMFSASRLAGASFKKSHSWTNCLATYISIDSSTCEPWTSSGKWSVITSDNLYPKLVGMSGPKMLM